MSEFRPYIPADKSIAEFTLKAILAGIVFGIIFGSANAYLGLRVGMTISTSIPIAVLSVAFFRFFKRLTGGSTILENNMAQTVGSASSSMASGLIFTIPALFMWGLSPSMLQLTMLAALGSLLGILAMVPLRQFLIVHEHENLPYPEGTACAEILKASEVGGAQATHVFSGLAVGAALKAGTSFLKLWPETLKTKLPFIPKAEVALEASPALLGVGYIVGLRIAMLLAIGGIISAVLIIPLIAAFGNSSLSFLSPDPTLVFANLSANEIWSKCIRFIGAGAVTYGGVVAVIKALPTMRSALIAGLKALRNPELGGGKRTEQDLPVVKVAIAFLLLLLPIAFLPNLIGSPQAPIGFGVRLLSTLCVGVFAFLFATVSSRVVGLVGVSSNPTSAMTIVSLLGTATLFLMLGLTDLSAKAAVLTIGTMVCVAASKAGDISQDLKAGYLLGATPRLQQIGQLIAACCAAFFVAGAVYLLGKTYTFGSSDIPAPQATLMKTVIEGVLAAKLPWGLIGFGAAIAAVAHLVFRVPVMPFAIGIYIPLATNATILVGGLLKHWVQKRHHQGKATSESEPGGLLSAGFIAGEGILGVAIAIYAFVMGSKPKGLGIVYGSGIGEMIAAVMLVLLALFVLRTAGKRDN